MVNTHNIDESSIDPNQPHSQEVEHLAIDSKNTFEVPFDLISSQFIGRYPPEIPTQPTLDPTYNSSPNIPHPDSSSNEELQGVSSEEHLYLIPKNEVNQLRHNTRAYLKSLGQIPVVYQIQDLNSLKREPNHTMTIKLLHLTLMIL